MRHAVLIVAAGRGQRAGGGLPKQYRSIGGVPMLQRTMTAILDHDDVEAVQVVIHADDADGYSEIVAALDDGRVLDAVHGGDTRAKSVQNGLRALEEFAPDYVHIHDAARPFLDREVLTRCMAAVARHDGAFPVLPVVDALWFGPDLTSVSRDGLLRAQTPQSFSFSKVLAAHGDADPDAADDVAVALAAGLDVVTVDGDEANFKVTTAQDFERAERMVQTAPDIRVGQGFDVHAFEPGDAVILCGVRIAHDRALKGHSDADVAMHAITDAIYGALAEGDIGQWFPPSDPQWKGASSDQFLVHAMARASARGFLVSHLDCTIICEHPKIGPHSGDMRAELSKITGIEVERISVKATTSERLGVTGRGEGIAAQATATLVQA